MANNFINVNFYGHQHAELSGTPDERGLLPSFVQLRRQYTLGVVGYVSYPWGSAVSVYNYNAVLGTANQTKASEIARNIMDKPGGLNPVFLVTGYSSGGVTAIYFGRAINQRGDCSLGYLGLADAAFYNPESSPLMLTPGVTGKYLKNYYQTKGNGADVAEIHGMVSGFTNISLDGDVSGADAAGLHDQAVIKANVRMKDDVLWCLKNYTP